MDKKQKEQDQRREFKKKVFVFCEAITELIFTPHQRRKKATLL